MFTLLGAIALMGAPLAPPANAQKFCPDTNDLTPAKTLRVVELKQFGIRVNIPSNFRTLLRNDGTVSILAPGDFNLIQCLAKGIPVQGTDAIQMDTFKLHANPQKLNLQEFVKQDQRPIFSGPVMAQTSNGMTYSLREAPERQSYLGSAHAWYQPNDLEGIVEITSPYKADLLDLLKRIQPIPPKPKAVTPSPSAATPPPPSPDSSPQTQESDNLIVVAMKAAKDLGYAPTSVRESITRENNSADSPTQSIVTLTQEGLLDDSIAGHQFIVTFQKNSTNQWEIVNLQKKRKCQPNRGAQTYSTELCI